MHSGCVLQPVQQQQQLDAVRRPAAASSWLFEWRVTALLGALMVDQ